MPLKTTAWRRHALPGGYSICWMEKFCNHSSL